MLRPAVLTLIVVDRLGLSIASIRAERAGDLDRAGERRQRGVMLMIGVGVGLAFVFVAVAVVHGSG